MKTYLITGASGFLGNALIQTITESDAEARILAFVRTPRTHMGDDRIIYVPMDLSEGCYKEDMFLALLRNYGFTEKKIDYIIHCAAITDSKKMVEQPIQVMNSIVEGTKTVLEVAASFQCDSMVYISSMEVYGYVPNDGSFRTEDELGELLLNDPRSSYPMAKRIAETYCNMYAAERKVPVKIARLAQTFGKYSKPDDKRVFMQFAKQIKNRMPIVLKTTGESVGNYCATEDAVSAILCILNNGACGETYNVVNEDNIMTIRQMAEFVSSEFSQGECEIVTELTSRATTGYARDTGLRMSSEKLRTLGWKPQKTMHDMYAELFKLLNE